MLPTNSNLPLHDYASGVEELDTRRTLDMMIWFAGFVAGGVIGFLAGLLCLTLIFIFAH